MALLFVASEAFELKPLASRLTGLRRLKWPLDYAEEGILDGKRYLLTANGTGARLATRCLDMALRATSMAELSSSRLEAVISTGICGALTPDLKKNAIVEGTEVISLKDGERFDCMPLGMPGAAKGALLSSDQIICTIAQKQELATMGALAVEMEAAGVAKRAKEVKLPFYCIKSVSDCLNEEFVIDFNSMRSSEGRLLRGKIVTYALMHPVTIPCLISLRRRTQEAASALGAFLASCRFQFSNEPNETSGLGA